MTGSRWGVVTLPLSPAPGKEKDDVDETAGDVTPGRTLVLQGTDTGVWTNRSSFIRGNSCGGGGE